MNTMTLVGWSFLLASWIIPFFMRKQANTFVDRQKSYSVGMLLAAVALVIFVINGIIVYIK
jgi:hypothetical protein